MCNHSDLVDRELAGVNATNKNIYVCPLSLVDWAIDSLGASHLITLINHDTMIETPAEIAPDNHLRLAMNDIVDPMPGMVLPNEDHVADLLEFTDDWKCDAPMLIHCWAGISRSTAAAFVALCHLNPDVDESIIARQLRAASPTAYPNRRIISLADHALSRSGRMIEAVDSMGRGEMTIEAEMFRLPVNIAI